MLLTMLTLGLQEKIALRKSEQCSYFIKMTDFFLQAKQPKMYVVVVEHIYLPVTGQRQTLTIRRSAHISLQRLLRGWRNPHLFWSFQ